MDLPSLKSSRDSIIISSLLLSAKVMTDNPLDFVEAFCFCLMVTIVIRFPDIFGIAKEVRPTSFFQFPDPVMYIL